MGFALKGPSTGTRKTPNGFVDPEPVGARCRRRSRGRGGLNRKKTIESSRRILILCTSSAAMSQTMQNAFDQINSYDLFTQKPGETAQLGSGHVCLKRTIMV